MRFLRSDSRSTLYCFSPPVMLFTFLLEFTFGLYILVRGKLRTSTVIIIALLVSLGIFQLAEFQVCAGERTLAWMQLGYASITLLPPLGIHLVTLVTKRQPVRNLGYILAAGFMAYFLISAHTLNQATCGGNYILVNTNDVVAARLFPLYYFSTLFIAIVDMIHYTRTHPERSSAAVNRMLYWLLGGYAAFLIPSSTVYFMSPSIQAGLPSIMCGFAIFLAIILTLRVYPLCRELEDAPEGWLSAGVLQPEEVMADN